MPATPELTDLIDKMRPKMRAMLVRQRVPAEDAGDLVQEVMLRLLRRWDDVRCKESWVLGALRFRIVLHFRNGSRFRKLCSMAARDWCGNVAGALGQVTWDARQDLSVLAALLPERQRQVLRLRYVAGLSTQEVADRLGLDAAAVRQDAWKARRGLRELFGRRGHLRAAPASQRGRRRLGRGIERCSRG